MGGNALRDMGIETERKTTGELLKIYSNISKVISNMVNEFHLVKYYREKKTHGDLDLLLKGANPDEISKFIDEHFDPNGIFINGNVVTFDYDKFQIDLICMDSKYWETTKVYYDYDPTGNLMGCVAKGFGLRYGSDGLYYKSVSKSGIKKFPLTDNNREIFEFLGYDFDLYQKGFNTLDEIFDFIAMGKYFDKKLFYPENLRSNDRKRSMKRNTYREFLDIIEKYKSNYNFKEPETYINYIDAHFPGFKDKILTHRKIDEMSSKANKKFRVVLKDYKSGKQLGEISNLYRLSKDDFENFILNNDLNEIREDFNNFYKKYMELYRMMDRKLGFGKKMGNDLYIHKNYENLIPNIEKYKELLPGELGNDFVYTIVKYNFKDNSVSFIKSTNFDTADEPIVDDSYKVNLDGNVKYRPKPKRDQIYHHKWMFVKPDYEGFDYQKSQLRSMNWFKNYEYDSKIIGYKDYWDSLPFNESYTQEEIQIANRTSRVSKTPGYVGGNPIVPRYVEMIACTCDSILDFGSGKYPLHAIKLKDKGYNKIKTYDFGRNFNPKYHDVDALEHKYDIIYASNVLNVQSSENMLRRTIEQIKSLMKKSSMFIANYPSAPRKSDLTYRQIKDILKEYFEVDELSAKDKVLQMRPKSKERYDKMNENINIYRGNKRIDDFESFKMIVKNYDITKPNSNPYTKGLESKEISWEEIFRINKKPGNNRYIKPYEKGNIY